MCLIWMSLFDWGRNDFHNCERGKQEFVKIIHSQIKVVELVG